MKKSLTAALTTALVVGAASTTFAAANPFSDVPMDHWAYDAVAQLADDGIIEGYGDGSYRGENEITRYEMAQMVAKAMAKEDQVNARQKAMIDRLAAEFSEELNNLGVRVANLESRIDNVKWTGELQYTYERQKAEDAADADTTNKLVFRLEPEATVNAHWKVKARLDATWDAKEDKGDSGTVELKRAYVEGNYGTTVIRAGKMPVLTEQGMAIDDDLTGASVTFGEGTNFTGTLFAGRWDLEDAEGVKDSVKDARRNMWFHPRASATADVQMVNLNWMPSERFNVAAEYVRIHQEAVLNTAFEMHDASNIWGVGATWKPVDTVYLTGGYWKNTSDEGRALLAGKDGMRAYNIELGYKGAEPENARTFGLYAAYRYVGGAVAFAPTFDGALWNTKGWEIGGQYTFAKNVVGSMVYFNGKDLSKTDKDGVNKFFARLEYFF